MMMRVVLAASLVIMWMTDAHVALALPNQPNATSFCKPLGGDSGIVGRASFGSDAIVPSYVLVFPKGPAFDAYANSVVASPIVDYSKPAPSFDEQKTMQAAQGERTRLVAVALESSHLAMLDKKGSFACGGLPTGSYVAIIPVTKREHDRTLGVEVTKTTYYMAVAELPKRTRKDRRPPRVIAPLSGFVPMSAGR